LAILSCAFECHLAEQTLATIFKPKGSLTPLSNRSSARMSANTAIQLQFIQYCVVKIVEITEIVDVGEYRIKEAIRTEESRLSSRYILGVP
jgi:hypothetical protein